MILDKIKNIFRSEKPKKGIFYCYYCNYNFESAFLKNNYKKIKCSKCNSNLYLQYIGNNFPNDINDLVKKINQGLGEIPEIIELEDKFTSIGRLEDNTNVINLLQIAPRQIHIKKKGNDYWLYDYEDFYPTYLNDELINHKVKIYNNDIISLSGMLHYKFKNNFLKKLPAKFGEDLIIKNFKIKIGSSETDLMNLNLRKNSFNCMLGKSGIGKSTLIEKLFWELKKIDDGIKISYINQFTELYDNLTIKETMYLFGRIKKIKHLKLICSNILSLLGLWLQKDNQIGKLSGGERKRVSIAIELLDCPDIMILDEPTSGLDSKTAKLLLIYLRGLSKLGITVLMTKHDDYLMEYYDNILIFDGKNLHIKDSKK